MKMRYNDDVFKQIISSLRLGITSARHCIIQKLQCKLCIETPQVDFESARKAELRKHATNTRVCTKIFDRFLKFQLKFRINREELFSLENHRMSMICAISQQTPEEPVISPLSGCIFEKRLIVKYISEYGKDPISNEPLNEEQLIEVKQFQKVVQPRTASVSSIPDMLSQLRNEWDACMLDSFELKQNLMTTRQELSHALYQLDASYRVIARLKGEVQELELKLKADQQ